MRTFPLLALLVFAPAVFAQSSAHFSITRNVIAGGGATPSSSLHFQLSGTVAQPLAAIPTSDHFSIQGGFWIWPAPAILPPRIAGTNAVIGVQTELGKAYTVQSLNSLNGSAWQNVSSVPGNGGIVTITNSATAAPQQFYRVIEQ